MDKILERHLANALVLAKSDLNIFTSDENIILYESCDLIENRYQVTTENDTFTSEIVGYWKDKPVIYYNKSKYAILENSNTIVKLKSLNVGNDKIKKTPDSIPTPQDIPSQINEVSSKNDNSSDSFIYYYVNTLKNTDIFREELKQEKPDTSNYIQSDKPVKFEDELFSVFDTKKDDPRFKRLFGYYSDQTKKEVHEINEKYAKQFRAKLLEDSGGGGTNAVQYANGGTIDGNLTITSNLSVLGTIYGQLDNKRVFIIGNNTDTDYILDHNFNTKDLVITMYDSNDEIVLAGAKNINPNQTLITFSEPPVDSIKIVIMR